MCEILIYQKTHKKVNLIIQKIYKLIFMQNLKVMIFFNNSTYYEMLISNKMLVKSIYVSNYVQYKTNEKYKKNIISLDIANWNTEQINNELIMTSKTSDMLQHIKNKLNY